MNILLYKLSKSVVPCILLTLSIGFCYAFSLFVPHLAALMACSTTAIGFTFCLNIFFLGMGAACFGPLAEKGIKIAATTSTILLTLGLTLSGLACSLQNIWLLYLGSGVCCGIAEGCGYVTPNKNMLLWFPNSKFKGILAAISIFTFGLGSSLCSYLFGILFPMVGIGGTFYALAGIYAVLMTIGTIFINKPKYALIKLNKDTYSDFSYGDCISDNFFLGCWIFMFLNISMGLILIGSAASILTTFGFTQDRVIFIMMLCGVFNGVGRLVFPMIGDFLKNRRAVWLITVVFEVVLMLPILFGFGPMWLGAVCIILIHAGYGSAFACLPSILSDYYGKDTLSQRHGFCLTAWGMASLMAFICTKFAMSISVGLLPMMIVVTIGYVLNLFVSRCIAKY